MDAGNDLPIPGERPPRPPHKDEPTRCHSKDARVAVTPLLPPPDADYTNAFQCLVAVQWQIQRQGPCADLILRRAHARYALGNFLSAALDAGKALSLDPSCVEASFLEGEAFLALAALKHGIARPGPGAPLSTDDVLPRRRHLLAAAQRSFRRVLTARPADTQAKEALDAADALLATITAGEAPTPTPVA